MRVLLAKLLCLVAVFLLMLAGSLLPVRLLRPNSAGKACCHSRRALSLCNTFAAGVFLATGFNALLPAVRDKMSEVLRLGKVWTDYPLSETLMLMGFFLTVFVEQLVLTFCSEKKLPFIDLETLNAGSGSEDESPFLKASNEDDGSLHHHPHHHYHSHMELPSSASGTLRLLGLSLALSAHSVLEGLALGLQEEGSGRLLGLFLGVALHEGLAALALGLSLARAGRGLKEATRAALPLSLSLPLGIGAGVAIQATTSSTSATASLAGALISVLLQGLATGTFLFVTFFEILGKELEQKGDRLLKVLLLVLGYALLATVAFLKA
nr:zinc transporter ZIP3 isoform X1 [Anolis sagrei ordinatus]